MKISTAINAHKVLVLPVIAGLMWRYDNWSTEAFVYLALHSGYALLWLVKHAWFRDKLFEERQPAAIAILFIFLPLAGYLVAPWLLISRHVTLAPWLLGLVVLTYAVGMFFHYVSDAMKYATLQIRPGQLIQDGFFGRTRNPNYLGEVLIYTALAVIAQHWLPFVILAGWFSFFAKRMMDKERSLSRYPEFAAYAARTGWLLPRLFRRGEAAPRGLSDETGVAP